MPRSASRSSALRIPLAVMPRVRRMIVAWEILRTSPGRRVSSAMATRIMPSAGVMGGAWSKTSSTSSCDTCAPRQGAALTYQALEVAELGEAVEHARPVGRPQAAQRVSRAASAVPYSGRVEPADIDSGGRPCPGAAFIVIRPHRQCPLPCDRHAAATPSGHAARRSRVALRPPAGECNSQRAQRGNPAVHLQFRARQGSIVSVLQAVHASCAVPGSMPSGHASIKLPPLGGAMERFPRDCLYRSRGGISQRNAGRFQVLVLSA